MNKYKILFFLFSSLILFSACLDDLNTEPRTQQDINNLASENPEVARAILATLYSRLVLHGQGVPGGSDQNQDIAGDDAGETVFLRSMWNMNVLTTDEAKNRWGDNGLDPLTTGTNWQATNKFFGYMYNRSYFNIAQINNYILDVVNLDDPERDTFILEARFLRALHYYYLLDSFGGVPIVTEADGVTGARKARSTNQELFDYIEGELLDIETNFPTSNEYGRADVVAVHMLLAKLYLNAEVYIGTNRYSDALTYSNNVVNSSYSLATTDGTGMDPISGTNYTAYQTMFMGDNNNNPEIIFPLIGDSQNVQSFGNTTYIINGSGSTDTMPIADLGNAQGWTGHRATSALYELFETGDRRYLFWENGHDPVMTDYRIWEDGYPSIKFRNAYADGTVVSLNFSDVDFPMFRLADAYLMYAEADIRVNGSASTTSLGLINQLRERAYGDNSGNIASTQLTLNFILDERARELYFEGHRRQDLRRFGRFTGSSYVWPWKGGIAGGTSIPSNYEVFPLPLEALQANPLLEQNPGY